MTTTQGERDRGATPAPGAFPSDDTGQLAVLRDARLIALGIGHGMVDMCASTLPIFYPLLASALGLNYGATSTLMTTQSTASALGQPFFGWLTDRFGTRTIAAASVLTATIAIALVGFAPSYLSLLLVMALLGLAVGAYHPQGAKAASILGGRWRASSMSVYLILGNGGYALGPLVAATIMAPIGLQATPLLLVPAVPIAAWLFANGSRVDAAVRQHSSTVHRIEDGPIPWFGVTALGIVIVSRSWLEAGMTAFLPLLYAARQEDRLLAGQALFLMFLMQGPGTVAGGWLADRVGRKPTIIAAFVLMVPTVKLFVGMTGASALLLAPAYGLLIGASATITILAAQELLPSRMGVASGIATSLSMIMGGVGVGLQGVLADRLGLEPVVLAVPIVVSIVAAIASAAIPRKRGR
ncbi:MAG TPA: MFS transporter [Chloroflexota bacterium]